MRAAGVGIGIVAGFLLFVAPERAVGAESDDLFGTWYVLIHYEEPDVARRSDSADAAAADSEVDRRRWDDKVWVFERRGDRLVWTEYSEIAFQNDAGRAQVLPSGRIIKSRGYWKPNAAQRSEIKNGLAANPQWVRAKTLRGDAARGYRSRGKHNPQSASVIGYSETWEILDWPTQPRFIRHDSMDSGRSVALEGETSYNTSGRKGEALVGEFSRDGTTGRFEMQRAGAIRLVAEEEVDEKWK